MGAGCGFNNIGKSCTVVFHKIIQGDIWCDNSRKMLCILFILCYYAMSSLYKFSCWMMDQAMAR